MMNKLIDNKALANEWDYVKNQEKGLDINKLTHGSRCKAWWICPNGHSYEKTINKRTMRGDGCPYCSGREVLKGFNDLETLYPDVAKEWDKDKNDVMPEKVSAYAYNSYYWICPKGHSYKKKVIHRTRFHKQIDCPKCIKARSTSFPEQAVYFYAKKCFPDAINRYKEPFKNGMELDIYVPSYGIGIEYDGTAFHNDEEQHDREYRKYLLCKKLGIRLVRIKESQNTWNDTADRIFYVKKRMNDEELQMFIFSMFSTVFAGKAHCFSAKNKEEEYLNRYYGFPTDFNIARDRKEILEYLVDVESSFGSLHPELAKMWSKKENGSLTPFMFTPGSNYPAIWEFPKCGSNWKSPISSIVQRKAKCCKACSMKENGKKLTRIRTAKRGSLAEKSEKLLRQWDYELNGDLSPYDIPLNYSKKVAWKCDRCGYRWQSSPNSRIRNGTVQNCPHCTGRVAMTGVDDLETLYPEIAKQWDYVNNNGILPSQIKPYSNKKYFWICQSCGKPYAALPGNRIKGSGCPDCARIRIGIKNSKPVGQYDENGALIRSFSGIHQAAKAMNVVPNSIFLAVKNGGKSKGYYWKYLSSK